MMRPRVDYPCSMRSRVRRACIKFYGNGLSSEPRCAARICFTAARQKLPLSEGRGDAVTANFVVGEFACLIFFYVLLFPVSISPPPALYTIRLTAFLIPNTITNFCYYLCVSSLFIS